jgi:hypothetical protein
MTEPRLRKVAWAHNQAEAELIQGLLREQGIPSVERRAPDVPDFLAAGPRDILVPEPAAERARELLGSEGHALRDSNGSAAARSQAGRPLRLLLGLLVALAIAAALVFALAELAA